MTDLERFIEIYKSFGIELEVVEDETGKHISFGADDDFRIKADVTTSYLLEGWSRFYTTVSFDKNGKFIKQGFWE